MDGGKKLVVNLSELPRRASVSVPIAYSTDPTTKRKVSSFEDNSSAATTTSASSSVFVVPSDSDNKTEQASVCKTLKKSHSIAKTCSTNAPIISVSAVPDDLIDVEVKVEEVGSQEGGIEEASCSSQQIAEPLAPLAEPDSESPASELPPSEVQQVDEEAKSNDVCPWEDE